ncbi:MAG: hypothetical protein II127_05105 [Ruminococcus sp.]|nr:hypothetical protein [Ruminococcus sp.]
MAESFNEYAPDAQEIYDAYIVITDEVDDQAPAFREAVEEVLNSEPVGDEPFAEVNDSEGTEPDEEGDFYVVEPEYDEPVGEVFDEEPEAEAEEAIEEVADGEPEPEEAAEEVTDEEAETEEPIEEVADGEPEAEEAAEEVADAVPEAEEPIEAAAEEEPEPEETAEEVTDEETETEEPNEEPVPVAAIAVEDDDFIHLPAEECGDEEFFEKTLAEEETPKLEIVVDNVSPAPETPPEESFEDSDDFFEEKPQRIMGVISSREIEEAEDYDVIGEEEQRAETVKRQAPSPEVNAEEADEDEAAAKAGSELLAKIGAAIKQFFIHLGYFFTNLRRAVKRRHAIKKRKRAEEERRLREEERRRQERIRRAERERQRDANGLVQVHRRDERRDRR